MILYLDLKRESKLKDKLAIFDMDGTLFDTSKTNYYSYFEAATNCGIQLPFDYDKYVTDFLGKTYKEMFYGVDDDTLQKIHIEKKKMYLKNIHFVKINYELFDKIDKIKDEYFIVLATSANMDNVEDILVYFNKKEKFDLILSRESVKHAKPDPEILLKAIDYFNIDKKNVIVYEDSKVGIEAAKKIGIKVIEVDYFEKNRYKKI